MSNRLRCLSLVKALVAFAICVASLLSAQSASASVLGSDLALGASLDSSPHVKASAPDISAVSAVAIDASGNVLFARSPTKRLAPASMAKIATALVVLRSTCPTELVSVSASATALNGSKVGLVAGRKYEVRRLVEYMLVASGCDAAYALAQHVAGSDKAFAVLMNNEGARLGLKNTHFVNSTGLDATGAYVSASDMATLFREGMKNTEFKRVVKMSSVTVGTKTFPATNRLLLGYPGCQGGKTGTTTLAGHSVVARALGTASVDVVIMASPTDSARYYDAARLLDWCMLQKSGPVLGSFTTTFDPSNTARVSNIRLAAAALNGRSITAASTASLNTIIGQRTTARGYLPANAIIAGELVPQVGGGVCQVATTAFNAVLLGGLRVVERYPHSLYLSMYPTGRDAAISWGGPDLKFCNDTNSTVQLRTVSSAFTVSIGLIGKLDGSSVTVSSTPLSVYAPMPVAYVTDTSLPRGTSVVRIAGQPGYTCRATRTIRFSNGAVKRVNTYSSTYRPVTRVIAVN